MSVSEECVQEDLRAEIDPYTMPQDYRKYLTGNTRRIGAHAADQEQKSRETQGFLDAWEGVQKLDTLRDNSPMQQKKTFIL